MADFHHYGISVADLGRSLGFYCDILGGIVILPPHVVDEFGFRRAVVSLNESLGIDINEHKLNTGETFDPVRTGLDHLGFSVSSYDALVAWVAYLDAKGVACSPIRNVEGVGEAFDFRDPDGIQIEFWHLERGGGWDTYVKQRLEQSR
jgi:glyoxylase I family protein